MGAKKAGQYRDPIRPKKNLGQHFLTNDEIAEKIASTLSLDGYSEILEIGPGTGILTDKLIEKTTRLTVMDIDREATAYLEEQYEGCKGGPIIILSDFLKIDLHTIYGNKQFAVIGNFPYNISTQIVFKALEYKDQIPEFAGMFQKEVAQRICCKEGSKAYGILSVLVQTFYTASYLFTVTPENFSPPPKVDSGVLKLVRKENVDLPFKTAQYYRIVKMAFNQRRKTLRNSLKSLGLSDNLKEDTIFDRRPEQLSVAEFIKLTSRILDDTI